MVTNSPESAALAEQLKRKRDRSRKIPWLDAESSLILSPRLRKNEDPGRSPKNHFPNLSMSPAKGRKASIENTAEALAMALLVKHPKKLLSLELEIVATAMKPISSFRFEMK